MRPGPSPRARRAPAVRRRPGRARVGVPRPGSGRVRRRRHGGTSRYETRSFIPSAVPTTSLTRNGSIRRHERVSGSRKNRARAKRCSSMPSARTATVPASGRVIAAASIAFCTVHQATPKAAATSPTARPESITASTSCSRSRREHRARGSSVAWVNVLRGQAGLTQTIRGLRTTTSTASPPQGRSLTCCRAQAWTRAESTPQPGRAPSHSRAWTTTRRPPRGRSMTSYPGMVKTMPAASRPSRGCEHICSITARVLLKPDV